jgi:hypothetical protein
VFLIEGKEAHRNITKKTMNNNTQIDETKITRLEVINHATNDHAIGRLLTLYKELKDFDNIELSVQDGGRTLKVFLRDKVI